MGFRCQIRSDYIPFAIFCVFTGAIASAELIKSFQLAIDDEQYAYLLIVLPISAGLGLLQRAGVSSGTQLRKSIVGLILLAATFTGIHICLTPLVPNTWVLTLSILELVVFWLAAFVCCFGIGAFRSMSFPLLFLFWVVPFPSIVLDRITYALQHASAIVAGSLLWGFRVPVQRTGILLIIPGLNIEVAKECSSFRSSIILFISGLIIAHLLLQSTFRRTVLIMATIATAIVKNGVRIFCLAIFASRIDPGILSGPLHQYGGVVFFALGLLATLGLALLLQKGDNNSPVPVL